MDERGTIDGGRQAGSPDVAPEDADALERDGTTEDGEGRQVGLGRVVEDRLSAGSPDPDDPDQPDAPPKMRDVQRASEESFPASDPPGFTGTKAAVPPEDR